MERSRRNFLSLFSTTLYAVLVFVAPGVSADTFPSRTIKIVVPIGTGSNSDISARLVAEHLSQQLNQSVIVENKPGAAGNIGAEAVAKASPDGYTLLWASNATHGANPALFKVMPYDPRRDFVPLAFLAWTPMVVAVRADNPNRTLAALLDSSRENSKKLNVAIPSTSSRVVLGEINSIAKTRFVDVAYKGSAASNTDLLGGHVDVTIDTMGALMPLIRSGAVRPLALSLRERSPALPELPTIVEAGVKGFDVSPWNVIAAPAGTPPEIVNILSNALRKVFEKAAVRNSLSTNNGLVFGKESDMTTAELQQFIDSEIKKWERAIRAAGIEAQ